MKTTFLVLLFATASMAQGLKMGALVMGKVQGDDGSAIGAAWVTIHRGASPAAPGSTPSTGVAAFTAGQPARPDGTFGFPGLDPGVYEFCASFPGTAWLNSCEWSGPSPRVTVKAEQILDGVVLTMKKGLALNIRVNDAGQYLSKYEKKTPGAHVLLGVSTAAGGFRPADMVGTDGQGHDYSVLIPSGASVPVVFYSTFFKLQDQLGNAVASAGVKIPIATAAGQAPSKLVLAVTGVVNP